ncbi:hypothetical protein ACYU0Q_005947, partial [Pseudomonas aeruginosa]
MSYRKKISVNSVLLDPENARHGNKSSQRDIYEWMCGIEIGQKVLKLAVEIAKKGISPLETPGVIPAPEGAGKKWVVVEGNRRVAALKFLNNPKLCPDPRLRKQYERLKAHAETPVASKVEFVVFADINDARYWIETRHGGENGGAGIINWGPMEFDNFAARVGKRTTNRPAVEMLDYAYAKGLIEYAEYKGVPVTTLFRLLSTPEFRKAIGCDLIKGCLYKIADDEYFDRAVVAVLKILARGEKTVTELKVKKQREEFADELKAAGNWKEYSVQTPRPVNADAVVYGDDTETGNGDESRGDGLQSRPGGVTRPRSGLRDRLFTSKGHGVVVPDAETKVNDILRELVTLKHSGRSGTPISVAFLLRALIELSSDNYIKNNDGVIRKLEPNTSLRDKVKSAARHMHYNGKLSEDQLDVIIRHCDQEGGMLNINTLQRY